MGEITILRDKVPSQTNLIVFRCAEVSGGTFFLANSSHVEISILDVEISIRSPLGEWKTSTKEVSNEQWLLQKCMKATKVHRCS